MNILKHVDILSLIEITLINPNPMRPGQFEVQIDAIEKEKQVVIDSGALRAFNNILYEKCQQFDDARDPKVRTYIQEFVSRMCIEWHRNGLLIIEDIPEADEDPYAAVRKQYDYLNRN
jgi:hypothetical protein